jgi:flagellar protein FliJ
MPASIFTFRLERVLDLRKREVEKCEKDLAVAIEQVRLAQAVVDELRKERAALDVSWQQALKGNLDQATLQNFHSCALAFEAAINQGLVEVERLKKAELACRALLSKAMTRKKVLERLRARALKRFNDEGNKQLQNQLDDFAIMRRGMEEIDVMAGFEIKGLEA